LPINIAIVCPREPWYHGGQERVVANTARHLKNHFDIEIYCTGDKNYEKVWNNIPVHVFKGFTKGYLYSPLLKKEIKQSEFDLIHAHGFTVYSTYVASKEKNSSLFVINPHFHEIGSTSYYRLLRSLYDPFIGKKILKKADMVICVSNIEKEWLTKKYEVNNKVVIIPNGIDIDKIKNAKPYDFDSRLILYIGRLEKYKNVHILVHSMKYLPEEYYLHIIGNGSYKRALLKLIRQLKLEKKVRILSDLSDDEIYRWLKTCNLCINLSEAEAFGITVIEALCAGKPVIVNDRGGLAELAKNFPQAILPVKIEKEFSHKKLAELIILHYAKEINVNLEPFAWKNIAERIKEVYNDAGKHWDRN